MRGIGDFHVKSRKLVDYYANCDTLTVRNPVDLETIIDKFIMTEII